MALSGVSRGARPVPRVPHRAAHPPARRSPRARRLPVVKLGFDAVDQVRRRVQQDTFGHRGRAGDPLYGIRRMLRRGHDHHSDRSWTRLLRGLDLGDPNGEVAAAWIAAQELRLLYRHTDPARAAEAFHRWLTLCADSEVPELHRLARTLDSWREELLARFAVGAVSNGPTEAINLLIKKIKRVGHGFCNTHLLPAATPTALRNHTEHSRHHDAARPPPRFITKSP